MSNEKDLSIIECCGPIPDMPTFKGRVESEALNYFLGVRGALYIAIEALERIADDPCLSPEGNAEIAQTALDTIGK